MTESAKDYSHLKYRTTILSGNSVEVSSQSTEECIDQFLNNDMLLNRKGVWSKLSKTEKYKRIRDYVNIQLTEQYQLTELERETAVIFFSVLLDRKKLSKNNELVYNKDGGCIEQITGLSFNGITRKFSINSEKVVKKPKTKKNIT
jgi:hypothetical protein